MRFDPDSLRKHTLVSGVDFGIRTSRHTEPTAIVTAHVVPGCASIVSVRTGVWTMEETRQLTAGTVVGCDLVYGELIGGRTITMHRSTNGIDGLAARVASGLWSFPTDPDPTVQQLIDDAVAWTPTSKASKLLMAWWICDALIMQMGIAQPRHACSTESSCR